MNSADVLVIGDGALGLFLADELAQCGVGSVTVVGQPGRAGGASRAAGAMLGCFGEVTKDTLGTLAGRAKFAVSLAAHKRWSLVLDKFRELAVERGERLREVSGTFAVLNSCGGELDSLNFAAMLAALEEFGEPWEETEGSAIRSYQPRTDARALRVVHLPNEGAVDGNQVLSLLEVKLARAGVRMLAGVVESVLVAGDKAMGVRLRGGDAVAADVVVVAAGAQSGRLLRELVPRNEIMPMFFGAGTAFVGRRVQGEGFDSVVRSPNRSGSCGLHLVPFGDGLEYLGATNILFEEPQLEPYLGMARFLAECAMQQLDERICFHNVIEWRNGNRPVTLDGFPLIGWASVPGLYVLTGTYRDGFHCAPVLTEHVASQILGKEGTLDIPFAPDRAPIRTWTVEESVDEYALHMSAGWFEAGACSPPEVSAVTLNQLFRTQAGGVYSVLRGEFGLGPDLLMYLTGPHANRSRLTEIMRYLRARGAEACTSTS